jgi:hypothetical protein
MQAVEIGVAYSVARVVDDAYLDEPYGSGNDEGDSGRHRDRRADRSGAAGTQAKLKAGTVIEGQPLPSEPQRTTLPPAVK